MFSLLSFPSTSKNSYTIKRKTRSITIHVISMRSGFIGPIYCEIHQKKKARNAFKILHYVESHLVIPWKCIGVSHVIPWIAGATLSFHEDWSPQHKIQRKKFSHVYCTYVYLFSSCANLTLWPLSYYLSKNQNLGFNNMENIDML